MTRVAWKPAGGQGLCLPTHGSQGPQPLPKEWRLAKFALSWLGCPCWCLKLDGRIADAWSLAQKAEWLVEQEQSYVLHVMSHTQQSTLLPIPSKQHLHSINTSNIHNIVSMPTNAGQVYADRCKVIFMQRSHWFDISTCICVCACMVLLVIHQQQMHL